MQGHTLEAQRHACVEWWADELVGEIVEFLNTARFEFEILTFPRYYDTIPTVILIDRASSVTMKTQASLFEVGSWVVYPSHGVGRLDSIEKFDVNGETIEFFVVSFKKNKLVLKLPVKKAIDSGLRKVLTKEDMETALIVLSQKSKKKRMMWSKRAQEYELKINSGDPIAIAEVLRDLYKDSGESTQSFSERQIFQSAMERLAREISVLDEIDEEDAVKKLEDILKAA